MIKLSLIDRKILFELDNNSRQPYSQIAKAVGAPQETVRYRINYLVKIGVINKFFTVVDTAKLGVAFYKVLLRLHNVNEKRIQRIIAYLARNSLVVWLVSLDGSYDISFVARVNNIMQLDGLVDDLNARFKNSIRRKVLSVNVIGEYLTRSYLLSHERSRYNSPSYTADSDQLAADETDERILRQLTISSRKTCVEIASQLRISPDCVLERIRKLERKKIITGYHIDLNNDKIDQTHYKVLLYLNNASPQKIGSFVNYCKTIPRIVYIIKSLGEWNYEIDVEVENIQQLRKIMMDLTMKYSSIISDYNALAVSKIYKYNFYP